MLDRQMTKCGHWPSVIHDDEVTVELPVAQHIFDSGQGDLTGCQYLQ